MKHAADMDLILLSEYGLPPVGAVIENYELERDNKMLIILDNCFDYYIKDHVNDKLKKHLNEKGIDIYFREKIKELMSWWMIEYVVKDNEKIKPRESIKSFINLCIGWNEIKDFKIFEVFKNTIKEMAERESNNFERRARKNRSSIRKLMENIYQARAKVLILRIDLWFEHGASILNEDTQEINFLRDDVNLLIIYRDQFIDHLREEYDSNLLGYVWRLEYGFSRGYHLHFMIMLDGQHHCKDVLICQSLGNHWKSEITKGKGGYFNCNARKKQYQNLAIGMVHYADENKKYAMENIIKYFTKSDRFFYMKNERRIRTIGRSGLMKVDGNKKGRKRMMD